MCLGFWCVGGTKRLKPFWCGHLPRGSCIPAHQWPSWHFSLPRRNFQRKRNPNAPPRVKLRAVCCIAGCARCQQNSCHPWISKIQVHLAGQQVCFWNICLLLGLNQSKRLFAVILWHLPSIHYMCNCSWRNVIKCLALAHNCRHH